MEPISVLQIILTIMTLFWLVAGWMRLRRYIRSLQFVDYDQRLYGQWYWKNRAERIYLGVGLVCLCLLLTVALCFLLTDILYLSFLWIFLLAVVFIPTTTLILLTLVPAILSIVALALAPREREVKQPLILTQRAVRLLMTAGVIEALPMLIALWSLGSLYWSSGLTDSPANHPQGNFTLWILLCLFTGPITYLLTPLALGVANLLNWPIDKTLNSVNKAV